MIVLTTLHTRFYYYYPQGWGENDRGVSFTFGGDVVRQFLRHAYKQDSRSASESPVGLSFRPRIIRVLHKLGAIMLSKTPIQTLR